MRMADKSRLSLNTATVNQWSLEECINGCVRHGIAAIDPWRDGLHNLGADVAREMLIDNDIKVSALCRGGMFTGATHWNVKPRWMTTGELLMRLSR